MRAKSTLTLIAVVLVALAGPLAFADGTDDQSATDRSVKVFKGKVTYRIYCSNCHGEAGHGDGNLAEMLTVEPADLTGIARANDGVFPTDKITALVDGRNAVRGHGLKEMPIWGDAFQKSLQPSWTEESDEQRAVRKVEEVVAFLESIQELEPPAAK